MRSVWPHSYWYTSISEHFDTILAYSPANFTEACHGEGQFLSRWDTDISAFLFLPREYWLMYQPILGLICIENGEIPFSEGLLCRCDG